MYRKPSRVISQATYRILQDIRAEENRQRQMDRGLGYGVRTPSLDARDVRPLFVGTTLEAVPVGDVWAA